MVDIRENPLIWVLQYRTQLGLLAAGLAIIWIRRRALWGWLKTLIPAEMAEVRGDDRLLVIAPHCDDETLGAGGLLHRAALAGCPVKVVLMTNGDGFRYGVTGSYGRIRPTPREYIRYACMRQEETLRALRHLGVSPADVIFLGYPDRGLTAMWTRHWRQDAPYTSPFTRCSRSPYDNAYSPGTPYCGERVAADLEHVMVDFQPTMVIVPHGHDAHGDHWAAHAFAVHALENLTTSGRLPRPRVLAYLIHRGNWPWPKGRYPHLPLWPPRTMAEVVDRWLVHELSPEAVAVKLKAIRAYRSQTALMGRYLVSFARSTELFTPVEAVDLSCRSGPAEHVIESGSDEAEVRAPTGDTLTRRLQGYADIRGLAVHHDGTHLHLRLELRGEPRRHCLYILHINRAGDQAGHLAVLLRPGREAVLVDLETDRQDRVDAVIVRHGWRVRLPLNAGVEGPVPLFVSAETRVGRLQIDSLPWTLLRIGGPGAGSRDIA